jgi:hypothetical protein
MAHGETELTAGEGRYSTWAARISRHSFWPALLVIVAMVLGTGLRVAQYIYNRSLWLDEASLALNIVGRSFGDLLLPLDYQQGAPLGFLLLVKAATHLAGPTEYGLRLVPLFSSLVALLLLPLVARRYLIPVRLEHSALDQRGDHVQPRDASIQPTTTSSPAVPLAVILFALSAPLVYYASETKQYQTDVLIALLGYLLAYALTVQKPSWPRLTFTALAGAALVWFSHPAAFVLAGVGTVLLVDRVRQRDWQNVARLAGVCATWALSFGICYVVSLRTLSENRFLLEFWSGAFMPLPPRSVADLLWFSRSFFHLFGDDVAGLAFAGLGAFAFVTGCVALWRDRRRQLALLLAPLFAVLLASATGLYPFQGRMILFLAPCVLLLVAQGATEVLRLTRATSTLIGAALIALLLWQPLLAVPGTLTRLQPREELRPVVYQLGQQYQPGDTVYVYYGAAHVFRFYAPTVGLTDYTIGEFVRGDPGGIARDVDRLRGRQRVWVVFSHVRRTTQDEEQTFLVYLNTIGAQQARIRQPGASAYLYDLSQTARRGS